MPGSLVLVPPSWINKYNNTGLTLLYPIPLPPLAEQHHIVAKIDELMTLCNQPETQLTTTQTETHTLLDSLLTETLAKQTEKD